MVRFINKKKFYFKFLFINIKLLNYYYIYIFLLFFFMNISIELDETFNHYDSSYYLFNFIAASFPLVKVEMKQQ